MSTMRVPVSPTPPSKFALLLIVLAALAISPLVRAQSSQPQPQPQSPSSSQPTDQTAPDAGGPGGDNGAIALPKKKEAPEDVPPPAPAEPKLKNPQGLENYSIRVDVPEVDVDVGVLLEKTGQFVPNLKPNNFKVYENGVEQKVVGFKRVEAPITALLVCEFAATNYRFIYDMRNAAWSFAQQLRPQDYVAMMTFDLRTQIVSDFTQDKRQLYNAIGSLMMPGFTDRNLFDALYEAEDTATSTSFSSPPVAIPSRKSPSTRFCRRSRTRPTSQSLPSPPAAPYAP